MKAIVKDAIGAVAVAAFVLVGLFWIAEIGASGP